MNVDLSAVVVDAMRARCAAVGGAAANLRCAPPRRAAAPQRRLPHPPRRDVTPLTIPTCPPCHRRSLAGLAADATALPLESNTFDAVLDKGTLDAMLCGTDADATVTAMLREAHRVLRPGGKLLIVTYGDPHCRLPWLLRGKLPWHISVHTQGAARREAGHRPSPPADRSRPPCGAPLQPRSQRGGGRPPLRRRPRWTSPATRAGSSSLPPPPRTWTSATLCTCYESWANYR